MDAPATTAEDQPVDTAETAALAESERETERPYTTADAAVEPDPATPSDGSTERYGRQDAASPMAARDGVSPILAGIVGALVALILAGGLQFLGLLGAPGGSGPSSSMQAELDALKQQVTALGQNTGSGDQIAQLSAALDAVKADLETVRQGAGDTAGLQALDARVKAVEQAIAKAGQAGGAAAPPVDLSALTKRVDTLDAAVKAAGETMASGDGRFTALEQSVAALTAKIDAQAAQPKVALSIAAAALRSAIERGSPFLGELETLAAIAPGAPDLSALRAHAESGVASRETLVSEIPSAAEAMIVAATPVNENAGFFDRLLQSAQSLVTVRPIGAVEGTGVAAVVARMEVAVKAGDLAAAVAEFDTLPDPVKAAGGAFAEKLKARQTVETLVDQAIAAAMKA